MDKRRGKCIVIVDIDGTIVPNLVDFERLRAEIRKIIGTNHPLKPLGESLESLTINDDLKRKAWELIEREELASIERLRVDDVISNVLSIIDALRKGYEIILVTIRSSKTAIPLLERIGLRDYIHEIVTRDLYATRKMQLRYLMDKSADLPIVFLGDTQYDQQAALELGLKFIKVESYRDFPRALEDALSICNLALL